MIESHEEMINLYNQLSINQKRNEFSSLLEKTNQIIDELLRIEKIENNLKIKNYNTLDDVSKTEDEIFTFFYEDLWNIKNRLLAFLILKANKDNN